jgi:hypothetical protein
VTEAVAADLDRFAKETPAGFESLLPFLASIREERERTTAPPNLPTRQATDYKSVKMAAFDLGIDYKETAEYVYSLKETTRNNERELNPHFAAAIDELHTSDYINTRLDEALSHTVLDLVLIDRLRSLEDQDSYYRLLLSAEVPVSIPIKGFEGRPELVKGRADWALGYGRDKANTGSILIVVEAKPYGHASVGMPQMLVYMAAVQEARRGHTNSDVFGMLSDSEDFIFAYLDSNKKLHVSRTLHWKLDQPKIITYVDATLLDAIRSSPHTTRTKNENKTLRKYRRYMSGRWAFGRHAEYEAEMAEAETDEDEVEAEWETKEDEVKAESGSELGDVVDVVMVDGCIRMVNSQMG